MKIRRPPRVERLGPDRAVKIARRPLALGLASLAAVALADRAARADASAASAGAPHAPGATGAPPPDLDAICAEVTRARASVKTLEGPFTQERTIGLLAAKVKSNGTLTLVRPDRLRWELAPPDDVVYWITPEGLAYRSARGAGHVSPGASRLAASLDDLRTVLGGDLQKLRARYTLRVLSVEPELAFEATPKPDSGVRVQKLVFALAADKVRPTRVELVEGTRDRTVIAFGDLKRDVPVDPARMRPPA